MTLDPSTLATTKVRPADASTPALSGDDIERLLTGLDKRWRVVESHLVCQFEFPTFGAAFGLATRIALLAEAQNHHPMMLVSWGSLEVSWSTDAISALSENDFVMAAKVDRLVLRGLGLKDG